MTPTAVAAVDDLFFRSRIKEAAAGSGVDLVFTATQAETLAAVASRGARLVLVDLHAPAFSSNDLIRALKEDARTRHAKVIGYFQHEVKVVKASAEGAGCDLVLPRSAFVKVLPKLFLETA